MSLITANFRSRNNKNRKIQSCFLSTFDRKIQINLNFGRILRRIINLYCLREVFFQKLNIPLLITAIFHMVSNSQDIQTIKPCLFDSMSWSNSSIGIDCMGMKVCLIHIVSINLRYINLSSSAYGITHSRE